jgi:hypothetical protein
MDFAWEINKGICVIYAIVTTDHGTSVDKMGKMVLLFG